MNAEEIVFIDPPTGRSRDPEAVDAARAIASKLKRFPRKWALVECDVPRSDTETTRTRFYRFGCESRIVQTRDDNGRKFYDFYVRWTGSKHAAGVNVEPGFES